MRSKILFQSIVLDVDEHIETKDVNTKDSVELQIKK